ncbi:MAG: DNA topoisomerase I [Candidatus Thorarchaeota archaeon]|nr:DNA topoisomerase I [Candidatus Thorarchaeota archaeon]
MSNIMVISEKPTAAKKIAIALDEKGAPQEIKKRGASYFECTRNGNTLLVVYALGHLFELKQTVKGWIYPRLEMEWVPKYEVEKKATNVKPIISLIRKLAKQADEFVIATDYDIEGSLIGYLTLLYACEADPNQAHRMIFSTLTVQDLQDSYEQAESILDFPMIDAGLVRHEIDWLYGINLTRALTLSVKNAAGWFKIVSTGRVQGPVLALVAERDKEINVFVPIPYWTIATIGEFDNTDIVLEYQKQRVPVFAKAENVVSVLRGKTGKVENAKRTKMFQSPPIPFNLGGLQAESYRHFGFKPSRTLILAQSLYVEGLISYPRTSSQQMPTSIDTKSILKKLGEHRQYQKHAKQILSGKKIIPVQGKKTDPAHPAIHPTGEKPSRKLTPSENKVYDLVVRRFLSLFGTPTSKESLRVDVECEGHMLYARGLRILDQGWMEYYEKYATLNERILPLLNEGDQIHIKQVSAEEKRTSPPNKYNPSSLLKVLEKEQLGTKATRARIVDSVRSRGYTLNDRYEMSTLGYALFETLQEYVPSMLSPDFTRRLEKEMEDIQESTTKREVVLAKAKENLMVLLQSFQAQESMIGEALVAGLRRYWSESEELGSCPKCGDGVLRIIQSPKTGKRFVGCSNYKDGNCDQSFPLPQKGRITPIDKMCSHCGYQLMKIVSGRRTWETCVNWTKCPGRQDDIKALEERRTKGGKKSE